MEKNEKKNKSRRPYVLKVKKELKKRNEDGTENGVVPLHAVDDLVDDKNLSLNPMSTGYKIMKEFGFPVLICLLLMFGFVKFNQQTREDRKQDRVEMVAAIKDLTTAQKEEQRELKRTLDAHGSVLEKLVLQLEHAVGRIDKKTK